MFTGIVQGIATVAGIIDAGGVRTIDIRLPDDVAKGLRRGDSLAVNGVCLTLARPAAGDTVTCDLILKSLSVTNLIDLRIGEPVNVERAAKQNAEIGGHLLSGHIDFTAIVVDVEEIDANKVLRLSIPQRHRRYFFQKGYIATEGCSLTIAECNKIDGLIELWLIPETRRSTTLDVKLAGDRVNVEVDRQTQVLVDTLRETVLEIVGHDDAKVPDLVADSLIRRRAITSPAQLIGRSTIDNG
ncbi:MAG: riboflavin synthase subunit alpha [Sphingomonas sp.]|nr:riboflavin synthase subunit alpha [Sphingomonas sp.]